MMVDGSMHFAVWRFTLISIRSVPVWLMSRNAIDGLDMGRPWQARLRRVPAFAKLSVPKVGADVGPPIAFGYTPLAARAEMTLEPQVAGELTKRGLLT